MVSGSNSIVRLRQIDPSIAGLVIGFAIFNLAVGLALITVNNRPHEFIIVNEIFSYRFWAAFFILNGAVQLLAYVRNSLRWMRYALLFGMSLKLFWLLALAARQFVDPGSALFLLIFLTFAAYMNFIGYVHFPDKTRLERWAKVQQR